MKTSGAGPARAWMVGLLALALAQPLRAHVTLRPTQPLRPKGFANVNLVVPNERHVDTIRVSLEVPDAFLKAGGRLSRVEYPPGWQVRIEKQDKPGEVYSREMDDRSKRQASNTGPKPPKSESEQQEQKILDELRKKWIKKITFEGGSIPPDGFKTFLLSFELPEAPGEFRFSAVQSYADGKDVSWSEMVQGAEHPAASIAVEKQPFDLGSLGFPLALLALLLALLQPIVRFVKGSQDRERHRAPV